MFWKKNGSTILTIGGAVGLVGTTVLAIKATPKALRRIDEAKEEKGAELTKLEVINVAGPVYIPTVLMGVGAITCMFGANILNKRQQASLASAYAFVDNMFKEYKVKIEELYGEDANERIEASIAEDRYKENPVATGSTENLYYDAFSKRYFKATKEDVLKAEAGLNKIIAVDTGAYLNEFYKLLGLEPIIEGQELGWSNGILEAMYWTNWVDFDHSEKVMDDGTEYIMITMRQEPVIDFAAY
jgi:hypothetical protein